MAYIFIVKYSVLFGLFNFGLGLGLSKWPQPRPRPHLASINISGLQQFKLCRPYWLPEPLHERRFLARRHQLRWCCYVLRCWDMPHQSVAETQWRFVSRHRLAWRQSCRCFLNHAKNIKKMKIIQTLFYRAHSVNIESWVWVGGGR